MSLDPLWDFLTSSWAGDVIDVIDNVVRVVPYTLLFLFGFLLVQGLMAGHASIDIDIGGGPAARALVHGAYLDKQGLSWSLGVPTALVVWKWLGQKVRARRQRNR